MTRKICQDKSNATVCEVYAATGSFNGTKFHDCIAYCKGYGLQCVRAYEDEGSDCTRQMDAPRTCGYGFTQPYNEISKDMICSCGKIHVLNLLCTGKILVQLRNHILAISIFSAIQYSECIDDPNGYQGHNCEYDYCDTETGNQWYDNWRYACRKKCRICEGLNSYF